jgi:hypothetical protein
VLIEPSGLATLKDAVKSITNEHYSFQPQHIAGHHCEDVSVVKPTANTISDMPLADMAVLSISGELDPKDPNHIEGSKSVNGRKGETSTLSWSFDKCQ